MRRRERLVAAALSGELDTAFTREMETVRAAVSALSGADHVPGTEVILTTSGTDAELCTLYVAFSGAGDKVVSVVVGPDETGSGVPHAAAGRHIDSAAVYGGPVQTGAPVDGLHAERVVLAGVEVRDDAGRPIPVAEVDREVAALAGDARARGARALVHRLDCSKTGLSAPSIGCLLGLRDQPSVDIVVDACQMRLDQRAIRRYLELGFLVLITGSKFFTGPPFCGAVLVPPDIGSRPDAGPPVPPGLGAYLRAEVRAAPTARFRR